MVVMNNRVHENWYKILARIRESKNYVIKEVEFHRNKS